MAILDLITGAFNSVHSLRENRSQGSLFPRVKWKQRKKCASRFIYQQLLPYGSEGKESACNVGHLKSIPRLGRSPGGEHGNPLQCSCLENPMDRGAWQVTVHGVEKPRPSSGRRTPLHQLQSQGSHVRAFRDQGCH